MIVRISTEGQYRIAEDQLPRLHELDADLLAAAEAQDATRFAHDFAKLLDFVRHGEVLADGHLSPSDAILPPPGTSLAEAVAEFSTEGLIPT